MKQGTMFITKKALPRRTFLRGMGAALALPLLDSMVPALSAATKSTPRLGFVYVPNGIIQEQWFPARPGPLPTDLPPILKPLSAFREQFNVMGNLAHLQANTFGDGVGDHPRASAVWLSGVHAWDRTRPGMEVRLGVTADQIAARQIGLFSRNWQLGHRRRRPRKFEEAQRQWADRWVSFRRIGCMHD